MCVIGHSPDNNILSIELVKSQLISSKHIMSVFDIIQLMSNSIHVLHKLNVINMSMIRWIGNASHVHELITACLRFHRTAVGLA